MSSIVGEVKKVARSKYFYLAAGILLGGTLLAYPVARLVGFVMAKVKGIAGGAANAAAGVAAGK